MENFILDRDIYLISIQAASFPDGIGEAFKKLEQTDPSIKGRTFYEVSHGNRNGIIYRAAVEEAFHGEAHTFGLEQHVIKKAFIRQTS